MNEPPKKKRRMLIIDVDGDTAAAAPPPQAPVVVPPPMTPGRVHGRVQQEILRLAKEAHMDPEKIEDRIWVRIDDIIKATTVEEAEELAKKTLASASVYFILHTKSPEKQAKTAERIARMHELKGDDEKAKQQMEKAKRIRAEMQVKKA